ncbi:MAG: pseudouridine synthase [Lachnospiraceae bacterium]|nr:pseudouridine synthase [Lachnospiraceae bacterium]MDY4999537.1 pseudouridine synthase [Lachnospiraceae bacterium]
MIRIDKYLCDMSIGSRSEIKEYIRKKLITVDGVVVTDPGMKISEDSAVTFKGEPLQYKQFRYYMLNKPQGVVSATKDNIDTTVMDLLKGVNTRDMFPVGRLDKDTEGLLIITNDGELSHRLLSPRSHVDKCYLVQLMHSITADDIKSLSKGVDIGDDTLTLPAKVEAIAADRIYLTITEGRYHQVKRMLEAVGNKVVFLKRVSFGPLELDSDLAPGQYRELDDSEIIMLNLHKGN